MQVLKQVFTQTIPTELRPDVYAALANAPKILNGAYFDSGDGCLMVVAAAGARRQNIDAFCGVITNSFEKKIAKALMISVCDVRDVIDQWDSISEANRQLFISFIREELRKLDDQQPPEQLALPAQLVSVREHAKKALATVGSIVLALIAFQ